MPHRTPKRNEYRRRLDTGSLRVLAPTWTPPVTGPVAVVRVDVVSATILRWTFSSPITALSTNPESLEASTTDEFFGCESAVRSGTNALLATYTADVNFLSPDEPPRYLVDTAPAGLTFASGTLALPQSGSPTNPFKIKSSRKTAGEKVGKKEKRKIRVRKAGPLPLPPKVKAPSKRAA